MKKINIRIPDNLTPIQEAAEIAKLLAQKSMTNGGQNKDIKRIGQQIDIIDLQTQITVTRFSKEPIIQMVTCNVCKNEYQNNMALYYWHNYGGNPKKVAVCSEDCQSTVIKLLGERAAKTKGKLSRIRMY